MKSWFRKNLFALVIGLVLSALPVLYVFYETIDLQQLNPHEHLIQNGFTYVFLLLFSYLNHVRFVPHLYLNKRYSRYAVVVVSWLLGVAWLPHRIEQWTFLKAPQELTTAGWLGQLFWKENIFRPIPNRPPGLSYEPHRPPPPGPDNGPPPLPQPGGGRRFVRRSNDSTPEKPGQGPTLGVKLGIIFLLGAVSTLTSLSVQTNYRLRQLEAQQLQAELRQLKAQIHPHFLFNTLNSIYALAIRQDDRTADTIVKLADFMRYMIRDAHQQYVSLEKELNYLGNYIDLQRARLRDSVTIHFAVSGRPAQLQIAPLLLFTFVENAFKHGVNPDEISAIRIELTVFDNELIINVFNRKVKTSQLDESTELGLENARERLQLLYPNAHHLQIDDTLDYYQVNLTLTLQ